MLSDVKHNGTPVRRTFSLPVNFFAKLRLYKSTENLKSALENVPSDGDNLTKAVYYKDVVLGAMKSARKAADEIEKNLGREYTPIPSYADLLFKI